MRIWFLAAIAIAGMMAVPGHKWRMNYSEPEPVTLGVDDLLRDHQNAKYAAHRVLRARVPEYPCGTQIIHMDLSRADGSASRAANGAEIIGRAREIGLDSKGCRPLSNGLECPCKAADDCSNKTPYCKP
jgi:hypothetical protein